MPAQNRRACVLIAVLGVLVASSIIGLTGIPTILDRGEEARTGRSWARVFIMEGAFDPSALTSFNPDTITVIVELNNTVTWVNQDRHFHTVTSFIPGLFDSDSIDPGKEWKFTFAKPGKYRYYCKPHPWMLGAIIVKPQPSRLNMAVLLMASIHGLLFWNSTLVTLLRQIHNGNV